MVNKNLSYARIYSAGIRHSKYHDNADSAFTLVAFSEGSRWGNRVVSRSQSRKVGYALLAGRARA